MWTTVAQSAFDRRCRSTSEKSAGKQREQPSSRLRNACGPRACYVCLEVVYATGLRVSELVTLPASSARRYQRMLVVRGKGGEERLVPLNARPNAQCPSIWNCAQLTERDAKSKWLFPSFGAQGHLTRQHFARELKALGKRVGFRSDRLSPHALRHALAESTFWHNGADLRVAQTLLGHSDISTTQIYIHVLEERLKSLVRDSHPLAETGEKLT